MRDGNAVVNFISLQTYKPTVRAEEYHADGDGDDLKLDEDTIREEDFQLDDGLIFISSFRIPPKIYLIRDTPHQQF